MRKMLSTRHSAGAFNVALLLLRIISGVLITMHGYQKLVQFGTLRHRFMDFLGMGSTTTLVLVIFAEFFCGLFIVLGLFTRFAAIPIIIVMCVVIFKVNNSDFFGKAETATLFLGAFTTILLLGPGRASVDGLIGK